MTLPHRIDYEHWRAAALPPSLKEQFELDTLVYGTTYARVDAEGRIERVHPLDAARLKLVNAARNARKRQRRARRGK